MNRVMHLVKILNTFFYSFFFHFFYTYYLFMFIYYYYFFIYLFIFLNTYVVLNCPATGMQNGDEASSSIILAD